MAVPTDATGTTSQDMLRDPLLDALTTMRQDADKKMKLLQQRYENNHDRKARYSPIWLTAEQYVYIDQPPLVTFAVAKLATK